jgi:hypothetical protein
MNARTETAPVKPTFKEAWASHRCIIPASWYYEWEHLTGNDGRKRPLILIPMCLIPGYGFFRAFDEPVQVEYTGFFERPADCRQERLRTQHDIQVNLKCHDICGGLNAALDLRMDDGKFFVASVAEEIRLFLSGHIITDFLIHFVLSSTSHC